MLDYKLYAISRLIDASKLILSFFLRNKMLEKWSEPGIGQFLKESFSISCKAGEEEFQKLQKEFKPFRFQP
ncbi:hypothetical protein HMPREF6123_0667, partial [Oribacterium sinus F0268]